MNPVQTLLALARRPDDLATLAVAGVIGTALREGFRPLILGLSAERFEKLVEAHFHAPNLINGEALQHAASRDARMTNEFNDLLELLLDHRTEPSEQAAWLAYAVASAAMGENHLWQDMGLPSREYLSDFLQSHFPALAAKNTGDMKWKKFFYRQLCERADVPICRSPRCADCCDFDVCFGPEEASPHDSSCACLTDDQPPAFNPAFP
jgi:nitrogen fixation protein NifQ